VILVMVEAAAARGATIDCLAVTGFFTLQVSDAAQANVGGLSDRLWSGLLATRDPGHGWGSRR
jgi:hypothetical protein